ncbi:MAG: hypothetical protein ACXVA2_06245, partial [Mucilaginibacter sp.]
MRPSLLRTILFISFSAILLGTGCKKATTAAVSPPSLTTADVILDVTSTSAQSGGTIVNIGSSALTANGVCYSSTVQTPTLADAVTKEPLIYYSYTFTSNLTGLTPNTTYYVRAYATNSFGTGYGNQLTFTTGNVNTVADVDGNV